MNKMVEMIEKEIEIEAMKRGITGPESVCLEFKLSQEQYDGIDEITDGLEKLPGNYCWELDGKNMSVSYSEE